MKSLDRDGLSASRYVSIAARGGGGCAAATGAGGVSPEGDSLRDGDLLTTSENDSNRSTHSQNRTFTANQNLRTTFVELNGIEPSASSMPFRLRRPHERTAAYLVPST
jgi:hypothetical protein